MSQPTANELAIMRRPNQSTDLYLAVWQPAVVEHGRVFPDAQIQGLPSDLADNYYIAGFTATNVFTSGTVKPGMTLVFGSADGKEDLGRTFVRGKSGAHYDFSVLENMPLVSGIYYRVYDFFELWPVFPRVTVDANNVITYYKDYDKTYNGQNSNFLPVAVVGPNTAAFVDDTTGQKAMNFSATGSYTIDGTAISNAYWEISRGSVALTVLTGTSVSYTFTQSGNYTIETRVVNANGLTGTAHRHYMLLNREGIVRSPYNPPLKDWKFEGLDGNWDSGGWQCKFSMGDDSDVVRDGALVVIFTEDVYGGGSPQSFGGYGDRENILFTGYVDKVDNKNNWQGSRATFNAKSAINLLQNRDMFSVSLETSPNPVDWTQIKNMTINRIIDHYLRWHSTFLDVCDYRPVKNTGAGDYPEQYEDIPRGEIFGNVRNILSNRLLANFVSDKQGRVFSEVNLNYMITGSRPGIAITFQEGDWIEQLKTIEELEYPTSSVLMGGVSYDSAISTGSAYLSRAPDALFPLHWGKAETKSGMTIDSQSTLNTLSGLYLAGNNSRFPSLSMALANNMRTIDIVPQEFYQLPTDYPFTDRDLRNLKNVWANRRFIPRRINYSLDEFTLQSEVVYEAETSGPAGETVRIPAQPPTNGTPEPPIPPGVNPVPEPPGLGGLVWEVGTVTGTATAIAIYGDYIYTCGVATPTWRIEKRRKSDGGLEWSYLYPSGTSSSGFDIYVDADGIFSCGYATQPFALFTTIKITDTPTTDWIKNLLDLGEDAEARGITKVGSYLFVVGNYPLLGVQEGRIEKRLASNGSFDASYTLGAGAGSFYDIDSDTELYASGPAVRNLDTSLSSHWNDGISSLYSIRLNGSYNYSYQPDHITDIITVQKLVNSDGSTVWESSLPISAFTLISPSKMDIGDNFVFIPSGIPNDDKIYELNKNDGTALTGFTTFANPRAVMLDGNDIYIAGRNSSGIWTIQKRNLSYT